MLNQEKCSVKLSVVNATSFLRSSFNYCTKLGHSSHNQNRSMRSFRKHFIFCFCVVAFFLITLSVFGQAPYFRKLGIEDGLPSSEVYMSLQDSKGYMWFATDRGVARYDGYQFKVFTTDDGLCNNSILGLYEDYKGRIWCYSYYNCISYIEENEVVNHPQNEALMNPERIIRVPISFAIDENDTIWIGHRGTDKKTGLIKISPENEVIVDPASTNKDHAYTFKIVNDNEILSSRSGDRIHSKYIQFISRKGKAFYLPLPKSKDRNRNLSACPTNSGGFIIHVGNEYFFWDGDNKPVGFSNSSISTNLGILIDNRGNLWQSQTNGGVLKGSLENQEQHRYLDQIVVSNIFQDKEDGIWLTTLGNGIYYSPSPEVLTLDSKSNFAGNRIIDAETLEETIYVGTYQGDVFKFNLQDLQVKNLFTAKSHIGFYKISESRLLTSIHDNTNEHLIVSNDGSIDSIELYRTVFLPMTDSTILELQYDSANIFNLRTHTRSLYQSFPTSIPRNGYVAKDGSFWIARFNDFIEIKKDVAVIHSEEHELLSERIDGITGWGDLMLFATMGKGLVIKDENKVWNISTEDGLLSNLCNSVKVDKDGDIWVCSNLGLSRVIPNDKHLEPYTIQNFTQANGLLTNEVDDVLCIGNQIWVRSDQGFSIISKDKLSIQSKAPEVYLENVKVNHQKVNPEEKLNLSYDRNNLEIDFVGLSFRSNGNLSYRYRLEGIDDSWQTTNNTSITFPLLPPGEYTFSVIAENHAGIISSAPAVFSFTILPPFWQRWWFYTLIILAIIVPLVWIIRNRDRRLKKESQLLMASLESEQKALRSQITPHFIFNSINGILGLITENEKMMAVKGLSQFAHLMRRILKQSENPFISLDEEIQSLTLYLNLEQLRFKENFSYDISWSEETNPEILNIPPMLLQPYVENAIWHGLFNKEEGDRILSLYFSMEGENLICRIEDNGIGRKKAAEIKQDRPYQDKSRGMSISMERLKLLNRNRSQNLSVKITDLYDENGQATGTRVEVVVPLDY